MKKTLLVFALLLCGVLGLSANPTVTLTVSGQGATKEEATANALRSAIEQAYGVFVSANTTILNDELIKDEIATVASGNIEDFQEISCVVTSEGETFVTLSATVAISKLQAYAKSKGSSTEFAGATFAMNMKMRELNKENEQKALVNMYYQLQELAPNVFDWELNVGYPTIQADKNYKVPMTLTAKPNDASEAFYNILTNTLNSLSLTPTEIEEYNQVGLAKFEMKIPQRNQGDLRVVLRNNPKAIMAYLNYLVDRIKSSYRIKQLSADGQAFYAKTAKYDEATDFYAFKKNSNSNVVMKADVFVKQDDMMTLQGFEVEHTPVNRITFKYDDDGKPWANDVVVYQDIVSREFLIPYYNGGIWEKLDNITIADGVTSIGEKAFLNCSSLASVTIPDSVTSIGEEAFSGCWSLTSITIPDSVTEIGGNAFQGTAIANTYVNVSNLAKYCEKNISHSLRGSIHILIDGKEVTDLVIPDSVTSIGNYAFYGCSSLASVTIPDSVTSIGKWAFRECSSLASVTIGNGVTSIGQEAFYNCRSLASIYCRAITPPSGAHGMFYVTASGRKIYVPTESVEAYRSAECWRDYKYDIIGFDFSGSDKTEEPIEEQAEDQPTTRTFSDFANEYMAPMIAQFKAKDEFETRAMHAQRVTEESVAALKEKLTEEAKVEYLKEYGNIDNFQLKLGRYDANSETFPISIKNNKGELRVGVPLNIARDFQSLWGSCSKTATFCVENDVVAIESITIFLPDGSQFVATKK